jgi:hypothetical protein
LACDRYPRALARHGHADVGDIAGRQACSTDLGSLGADPGRGPWRRLFRLSVVLPAQTVLQGVYRNPSRFLQFRDQQIQWFLGSRFLVRKTGDFRWLTNRELGLEFDAAGEWDHLATPEDTARSHQASPQAVWCGFVVPQGNAANRHLKH